MESYRKFGSTTSLFTYIISDYSQPGQANAGVIGIVLHKSTHVI